MPRQQKKMRYRHMSRRLFPAKDIKWAGFFSRELAKADIRMLLGTYISVALLTSVIAFSVSAIVLLKYFFMYKNAFLYSTLLSIPVASISLSAFYMYPFVRASSRARDIDEQLPIALYHISAAGCKDTGAFFTMLYARGSYGALSSEAKKALECMSSFGTGARIAALKVAEATPSIELKKFLFYFSRVHTSGIREFLRKQAARRLQEYRQRLERLERRHGAFAEGYAAFMLLFPIILVAFAYGTPFLAFGAYFAVPLINILLLLLLYRLEAWDATK